MIKNRMAKEMYCCPIYSVELCKISIPPHQHTRRQSRPNWNAPNDKNDDNTEHSQLFLQFLLAFTHMTLIKRNINNDDQVTQELPIQIITNQFKCITREKTRDFVRKVATPGHRLTFLWTLKRNPTSLNFARQNTWKKFAWEMLIE